MSSNEKTLPSILESFVIAFSMYSRIPMPFVEWSECGMKYAFCFFPLIGVVIGACVCAFCWLSVQAGLGILAFSCRNGLRRIGRCLRWQKNNPNGFDD